MAWREVRPAEVLEAETQSINTLTDAINFSMSRLKKTTHPPQQANPCPS